MRIAAKRDAVEGAIVQALIGEGCLVHGVTDRDGFPDLVVWSPFRKGLVLLEVKDPKTGALTPAQVAWHAAWAAASTVVCVVKTPQEALLAVGANPKKPRPRAVVHKRKKTC